MTLLVHSGRKCGGSVASQLRQRREDNRLWDCGLRGTRANPHGSPWKAYWHTRGVSPFQNVTPPRWGFLLPRALMGTIFPPLPRTMREVMGRALVKPCGSWYLEILVPICFPHCCIVCSLVALSPFLGHAYLINTVSLPNSLYKSPQTPVFLPMLTFLLRIQIWTNSIRFI